LGGYATANNQQPFWLRANQYGTVPVRGSLATGRFSALKSYRPLTDSTQKTTHRLDWGFGVNAVVNATLPTTSGNFKGLLPEAYVKLRLGKVELYAGNQKETVGISDTVLTSGGVVWSGNALPIPKIQVHTPGYVPLGFTKQFISFRVGYAHGWFINSYIKGSYLHQKYAYIRLGKPHWAVRFYAGLNHQVQWGGKADYLVGTPLAVNGQLPTAFKDYLSLVTGRYPDALQNNRFTDFDGTNRIGNHIGSYDIGLEITGKSYNWLLYHQHLYEDASGLALQNLPDGLTGLRYVNRHAVSTSTFSIRRLVFEWLSTTQQSGPVFDPYARFQGGDNYFNHSQYRQGWTYQGRTIGTPFLVPFTELSASAASLGGPFFPDNRVTAGYIGVESTCRNGPSLTLRTSYSRHYGTFTKPYPTALYQFSALLMAQWALTKSKKTVLTTSLAIDRGELFENTLGGFISVRKIW
jgi:hypothetical protein